MAPIKLTVLGNTGRYLAPLSGGSSYLIETHEGARILLDAGGGAREVLAQIDIDRLDAVVISHFHFDHVLDLVTLRSAMDAGTTLVIPPGERPRLDALAKAYAFDGPFDLDGPIVEADPRAPVRVRDVDLLFSPTQHSAPSFATRIGDLVYASDTAPCDGLRKLARGAGLLLMHTLIPTVEPEAAHARVHATAQTAGALAVEVGARRLLLSHRYHGSTDPEMREAAAAAFAGVELARDRMVLELEG